MNLIDYAEKLSSLLKHCEVDLKGETQEISSAVDYCFYLMEAAKRKKSRIFFIGNGGSAAIASHFATDFSKAGGMCAMTFNDSSLLTCLSNDFSYAEVFSKSLSQFSDKDDILFAISSSGQSENILNGVYAAKKNNCHVITLSGFSKKNPLRGIGDLNFYLNSHDYGPVEIGHTAILHYLIDSFVAKNISPQTAKVYT